MGVLGSPPPVRPWRSQNARPFRLSLIPPCPKTRLFGRSSPGVQPLFTVCPEYSAPGLSTRSTSPGVQMPLQRMKVGGAHVRPVARTIPPMDPTPPATAPLAGFLGLSAVDRSPNRPTIFRWVTLVGFYPSRVCAFSAAPAARHCWHPLLTLLPRDCASPILGGGVSGAFQPMPRTSRLDSLIVYRVFIRGEIGPHHRRWLKHR